MKWEELSPQYYCCCIGAMIKRVCIGGGININKVGQNKDPRKRPTQIYPTNI